MIIPNIWKNKKCSKPPTRYDVLSTIKSMWRHLKPACDTSNFTEICYSLPTFVILSTNYQYHSSSTSGASQNGGTPIHPKWDHFGTEIHSFRVPPLSIHTSSPLYHHYITIISLVGGWATPLKNIRHLGWLFPIYGKTKHVPNHQPAIMVSRNYHQQEYWLFEPSTNHLNHIFAISVSGHYSFLTSLHVTQNVPRFFDLPLLILTCKQKSLASPALILLGWWGANSLRLVHTRILYQV